MTIRCAMTLLMVTLLISGGCHNVGNMFDHRSAFNVDSWATESPYRCDEQWQDIDPRLIHVVPSQNLQGAVELLRSASIVPLSPPQAAHLAGKQLTAVTGTNFYLVRAVALNEGGYTLSTRNHVLWVGHNCMGGTPVWMKRRALVVQLPFEPGSVYVTCHMTE